MDDNIWYLIDHDTKEYYTLGKGDWERMFKTPSRVNPRDWNRKEDVIDQLVHRTPAKLFEYIEISETIELASKIGTHLHRWIAERGSSTVLEIVSIPSFTYNNYAETGYINQALSDEPLEKDCEFCKSVRARIMKIVYAFREWVWGRDSN